MFQNPDLFNYVNYHPDPNDVVIAIMTDAELIVDGADATETEIEPGLTRVQAQAEADGAFSVTFTTNIDSDH